MEIKSNNVLIGTFAIAAIVGIFLFALWVGRVQLDQTYNYYEVLFSGSVSGLSQAGTVEYNGIRVGRVVSLTLDDENPSNVVALIEVDARTPVREDSRAQLALYGLTGVAYIELSGGSADAPPLRAKPGDAYPVIEAAPSTFQELAMGVPEAVENANRLVSDLRALIRNNEESVGRTLDNIADISEQIARSTGNLETLAATADTLLAEDVTDFIVEAEATARAYRRAAERLDRVVAQNEGAIDAFAREGLSQVPPLVEEMRDLVVSLDRLVARAEDDPAQFLFGRDVPEYRP